jgi:hypothetical protein
MIPHLPRASLARGPPPSRPGGPLEGRHGGGLRVGSGQPARHPQRHGHLPQTRLPPFCAFDNCYNRYSIGGAFCNYVDECDLYIYSSLNNTWTIVQSDNNAAQIVVDMPDDQEAAINSSYRAYMIQKTKYDISIKPELEALPSIGTNITEKQLKKVKQLLLNQQNSDEKSSKTIYVRDKFGNLYDIFSVQETTNQETAYTMSQFIKYYFIEISFAVIVAAFFLYVKGLGVK